MRVKIHREGTNILVIAAILLLLINVPLWLFCPYVWITAILAGISVVFYLLVVNFYRSPRRNFPGNPVNAVVASADGKVVALEETYEPEYLKCRCIQLSVCMPTGFPSTARLSIPYTIPAASWPPTFPNRAPKTSVAPW